MAMTLRTFAIAALTATTLAACAAATADDASLRDSFAERIAGTDEVSDLQRAGDELTFTGPDGAGETTSWRVVIDTTLVEPNEFDEEMPWVGRLTATWYADGEEVEWLDTMTALPSEFLDRGLAQECWANWVEAERRWDW